MPTLLSILATGSIFLSIFLPGAFEAAAAAAAAEAVVAAEAAVAAAVEAEPVHQ